MENISNNLSRFNEIKITQSMEKSISSLCTHAHKYVRTEEYVILCLQGCYQGYPLMASQQLREREKKNEFNSNIIYSICYSRQGTYVHTQSHCFYFLPARA